MTKIYLIRHAEAEGNLYRRIQGHYDGDITETGKRQIEALSHRFKNIQIDALYASDLQRTQKTAGAILKHHSELSLNIDPRLKEIGLGIWEDQPWGNASFDYPEQMLLFGTNPEKWHIEGGESFVDLKIRITEVINELAEKHKGQTIACVSHGMAIRTLISTILGVSSENISQISHGDNTCVALLNIENGKTSIEYYNDTAHLDENLSTFAKQGWHKNSVKPDITSLRFYPMELSADAQLYKDCYKEGWQAAHGTTRGYREAPYIKAAAKVSSKDPLTLMKALYGDEFAGILELDPERMAEDGAGWISFVYIAPEFRGRGLACQLIGQAVSYYRKKGRSSLCLHVSEINSRALALYESLGFHCIGSEEGNVSILQLLQKSI
jgi:probable phosphoglycerate mutase